MAFSPAHATTPVRVRPLPPWRQQLNGRWHKIGLQLFMVIVLAHWAEHLVQAFQIWALHWPVAQSRGVLGQFYPWLVKSEALHYGYAVVMLIGLWLFLPGFTGTSRKWWIAALAIQIWHHFEHALLLGQVIVGHNLFGSPVPMSIIQLWIPRVELHLFYNTLVTIPMVMGMYYHMYPPVGEESHSGCTCSCRRSSAEVCSV